MHLGSVKTLGSGPSTQRPWPFMDRHLGPDPVPGTLGCVLVHGFTGSPYDLGLLGRALADDDFPVEIPLLTGHGDGWRGIGRSSLSDWRADVAQAVDHLQHRTGVSPVVVGFSMGGLLALDLALNRREPLAGIASLSAPLTLPVSARVAVALAEGLGGRFGRALCWPKFTGPDIATRERLPGASRMPLAGVGELLKLMDSVRGRLRGVRSPLLVLHALQDHTSPFHSATELVSRVQSRWVRLVTLETGYHVIPRDVCRETVIQEVVGFARGLRGTGEPEAELPSQLLA